MVNNTAGLIYQNQSGALDESFADIFGHFVDNDDWTIGEASGFGAIRDMSNPPRFSMVLNGVTLPNPDRMSNFLTPAQLAIENNAAPGGDNDRICEAFETCMVFDNGGVHQNSGIKTRSTICSSPVASSTAARFGPSGRQRPRSSSTEVLNRNLAQCQCRPCWTCAMLP